MEMMVAKAICREIAEDHLASGFAGPQDFQDGLDADWCEFLPTARAAIRAMRDVVPVVRTSDGYIAHELRGPPDATWRCLIDAASPEEE
jgi:hypothetical protein